MSARRGFAGSAKRYFTAAGFSGVVLLPEDPRFAWAREAVDSVRAWQHPGAYSNYISHQESPPEATAMYGPAIYSRLAQVKRAYDPDNMFRSAPHHHPGRPAVTHAGRLRT